MRVLVLNAGSSTLKASVLDTPGRDPIFTETVDRTADAAGAGGVGGAEGATGAAGRSGQTQAGGSGQAGVAAVLRHAAAAGVEPSTIEAVGHRIVHGGLRFRDPVLVDGAVEAAIDALTELAPLHNGPAAVTLRECLRALPGVPNVAAFDTAFHATLPEAGYRYPVPDRWYTDWGVRRFGFHGLSVEWAVRRTAELLDRPVEALRLVVAHLGSGCSVTAVDGGRSVDTSMGLTPLEGLMMGTRAGSIDPGIVLQLLRRGIPAESLADDLEHRSGLVGIAGSQDVRELLVREAGGEARATLALELFVRRAAGGIAAAATTLDAVDALVFTGGIGENAGPIRTRICRRLAAFGVPLPADGASEADEILANAVHGPAVVRVRAREDVVIAEATARLIAMPA